MCIYLLSLHIPPIGKNTKSQSRPPSLMIFPARNHHFSLGFPSRFCRLRVAGLVALTTCLRDAFGETLLGLDRWVWSLDPATSPKKGMICHENRQIKGYKGYRLESPERTKCVNGKIFVFLGIHQVAILGSVWSRFVVRPGSMRWTEPLELGRSDFVHPWIYVKSCCRQRGKMIS